MSYIFDNDRPIYIQIVEQIRLDIISGKFKSGERMPSVRDLALTTRVNPNTMQRALVELENLGLVYTDSTNGKYVTENKKLIEQLKKDIVTENVNKYLKDMKDIGIEYLDAVQYLKEIGGNK